MWSRVLRRLLLSSAIVAVFLCLEPRLAHAQAAITIFQETSLPRVNLINGDLVQVAKRPINLTPEGVSYQDCLDNVRIRFPVQLANFEGQATLEAWAGLSGNTCGDQNARTSVTAKTCWRLTPGLPITINQNVDIPVRTIMSGAVSATTPVDDVSICGKVDLTTIAVNFLYFSPGNLASPGSTKTLSVSVDTVGPSAPTGLKALPGNTRLAMQWNSISGESGVSVLTGIRVYCDPNNGASIPNVPRCQNLIRERSANPLTPTDGGTDADAGTTSSETVQAILDDGGCVDELDDAGNKTFDCTTIDSGTIINGNSSGFGEGGACANTNLSPTTGSFAPTAAFNECFGCGSITGNTGTSVVATSVRGEPLTNGTVYALSVAATDAFDNVGPLSTPLCEYPELTNDFWDDYKNAGGNAGGGCATTGEAPTASAAVFGVSIAVIIANMRARKKRKSK